MIAADAKVSCKHGLWLVAHVNYKKHALRVSRSYRGSRRGLVQAQTLARCSRKFNIHSRKIMSGGEFFYANSKSKCLLRNKDYSSRMELCKSGKCP